MNHLVLARVTRCRCLVERRQRVAEEAAAPARLSWTIVQCGHAAVAPVRRSASGGRLRAWGSYGLFKRSDVLSVLRGSLSLVAQLVEKELSRLPRTAEVDTRACFGAVAGAVS